MDLKARRAELLARSDLVGADLRAALTRTADEFLRELLGPEEGVALVAVGGYGRQEPAPGSDLDLVLVHDGRADIDRVADRVFYPIWDTGVGLDHSVRTVREAVAVARDDLKAALGLLDARHVAGDPGLAEQLRSAARSDWRANAKRRLTELTAALAERWRSAGELAYLLEPDLKESRGGLRDVHALRAAAAAWVLDQPDPRVGAGYQLLLDVRGELHRRTGRGADRLVMQEQDGVAQALGFDDADVLMTAVYSAGRVISYAVDVGWRRVGAAAAPPPRRPWRRPQPVRTPLAEGVVEQDGEVVLARAADPPNDPALPLRVAAAAAEAGLAIAPHTLDRLAREAPAPDEPWPDEARQAFLRLLGAGPQAVPVIEALDQAGLLTALLPEWERVRCRPQRNAYHRFTVDRHLVESAAEAAGLTSRVDRPDLLLLGAFLHDIGKGLPGDHSQSGVPVATRIAERVGLPGHDARTVGLLVRHHLLLADTATRRDLDDPATISMVAARIPDRQALAVLHCLTEADGRATGPAAWGDWKAGLVGDLVRRVDAVLAGAPNAQPAEPEARIPPEVRQLAAAGATGLVVEEAAGGHRVTVVAPDRPGLLWRSAALLALHRLDVRAANATSLGASAVTMFDVAPRFGTPPDWDLLRDELRRAFDLPLGERLTERESAYRKTGSYLAPPLVEMHDDLATAATVIDVRAHDTVGLLYRITRALAETGLDVRSARVHTIGPEAVDSFYVTEVGGGKLADPARREAVRKALVEAVGGERR